MPERAGRLWVAALTVPLAVAWAAPAAADTPTNLGEIVVTATRTPQSGFETPTAVSVITGNQVPPGAPGASLAESLARVPGVVAQNRGSYAQDLQISMRGFGSRASFGVRGIRLLVDGIPVSDPGGQGETDIFDLGDIARIEVLRGPFSTLYGNAAGGVIQVFTKDGPPQPTLTGGLLFGSYGTTIERLDGGGTAGNLNYNVNVSHFLTDGYREHSGAERDYLYGKFRYTLAGGGSLTLLVNGENQPYAHDPSGLTRAQVAENPRQAVDRVLQFGAGESHRHRQGGVVYDGALDANDNVHAIAWYGSRRVIQYLPFAGDTPLSGGAVVDLSDAFGGGSAHWTHDDVLFGVPASFTFGFDYQRQSELRKGFVNDSGVEGALARNENDVSAQLGEYVQDRWLIGRWQVFSGIRHTRVSFDSDDHFITAIDPDDSGIRSFFSTDPVGGLLYELTPALNFYANYGRGFETPVFSELAYRPDGTAGFNGNLDPSTSENYEAGIKGDLSSAQFRLAAFHIHTSDEIIVASSSNGRTSFRNAGSTSRNGVELSIAGKLGGGWHGYAAYSYLNARFSGGPLANKWLPGVPRDTLYGALTWSYAPLGFSTTLDAQWRSHVYVDEQNSDYAAGYVVADCQLGFRQSVGGWEFSEYGRIDNLFDRSYIGAVIVDASNDRYFEPAPTRYYVVGLSASYSFR